MKANDLFQRTSTLAFSTVGIIAAGVVIGSTASASPVYVSNGINSFCFFYLEPDPYPCLELLIVEDACLRIQGVATGMGDLQSHYSLENAPTRGAAGGHNLYAVAVGVTDDAAFVAAHDGSDFAWEAQIVSRAAWDSGFAFPGNAGLWTPVDTTGTFDNFFGSEFDQAAVFWATGTSNLGALVPGETLSLFAGPQRILSFEIPLLAGFVALGDNMVVDSGHWAHAAIDVHGLRHTTLGEGLIDVESSGALRVSNIGSSGKDGVRIDLGETTGWSSALEAPASFEDATLNVQVLGQANGTAGSQIFALNMQGALTPFGQNVLATFDFTSIGSTTALVELYAASGALIAEYETDGPTTMVITEEGVPSGRVRARCEPSGDQGVVDLGDPTTVIDQFSGTPYSDVQEIRVRALGVSASIDFISDVLITAQDLGPIALETQALQFGDHGLGTIDNAQMHGDDGKIKISNIGSSGCDGFCWPCDWDTGTAGDPINQLEMIWSPLSPCDGIAPPPPGCDPEGAMIELHATGTVAGTGGSDLGWLRVEQDTQLGDANDKLISADYSAVGSKTLFVEVLQDGVPVFQQGGLAPGAVARTTEWPKGCGKGRVELNGEDTACYSVCWPNDVSLSIPGAPPISGDVLRVLAESPDGAFGGVETFSVLAANIFEIELLSAQVTPACPGDADGDGAVGLSDLNLVLSGFGQSVPPGTNGDIDGDGNVTLSDLNQVLSNFGTTC